MPPSLRKSVLSGLLALAAAGSGFSQSFVTYNKQYSVVAPAAGDQVHPAFAINAQGGYLVWDDNSVDGRGQGIGAQALDSNFNPAGPSFRVNQIGTFDQENPQASLLTNGGATFVWQGGKKGYQHIYTRFIGAGAGSNYWLGGDVLVDAFTNTFQINPAVTTLSNGNVLIVWASYDEYSANSMQDIYGQLFSPTGQKIGAKFLVNVFTAYNQRTPAVAALPAGGFVVVWASEQQQRSLSPNTVLTNGFGGLAGPSVDIYGRLFDGDANPLTTNEFLVDLSTNVCANPSVASGSDGGFFVVWSARDASTHANSWDIYGMPFNSMGSNVLAAEERINTYTYGDQYAPKVSAVGTQYQVVWTSLGQDGSLEGVYGQFVNGNGSFAGSESLVNTTTKGAQLFPATASDGANRFLVAWSSFGALLTGLDLFGQIYAPPGYTAGPSTQTYYPVLYDPYPDPSLVPAPTVPIQSVAESGLSNSTALVQGQYRGLFYNTNGVSPSTAGYLSLRATKKGTYSGTLDLDGHAYSISGHFNPRTGGATNTLRKGSQTLTLQMQLDSTETNVITGQILGPNWSAQLEAVLQATPQEVLSNGYAGYYVMTIPSTAGTGPQGDSYGTVKVDHSGNITWTATLSDKTKVSQDSGVSADGLWPLYVAPYKNGGAVLAWMQFATNGSFGGDLVWMKSSTLDQSAYSEGFTNDVQASGMLYLQPEAGNRILNWTGSEGNLILSGAGLAEPLTNSFRLDEHNHAILSSTENLSLSINVPQGTFSGKAKDVAGQSVKFSGVLWPEGFGLGFFSTTTQSGGALLAPAPTP